LPRSRGLPQPAHAAKPPLLRLSPSAKCHTIRNAEGNRNATEAVLRPIANTQELPHAMNMPQNIPALWRRIRPYLLGFVIFFAAFGLFGFFAGPPIARSVLMGVLSKQLHRSVSLGDIHINPYAMSVRISNLRVAQSDGGPLPGAPAASAAPAGQELFGFDELFVDLDMASVFRAAPVVETLRLTAPRFHLVRTGPGRYNISDLLDEWLKPSDSPTPRFSVNNIAITGGRVDFDDLPVGKQHVAAEINIALPFISNLSYQAEEYTEPAFSAVINGAPLKLEGKSKPFAEVRESELRLALKDFTLDQYLAYAPRVLPFTIKGGHVDTDIRLVFRQAPKEPASLNLAGGIVLRGLHLLETGGAPLLNMEKLEVPLIAVAPLADSFQFGQIGIDGLEVFVRTGRDGSLNWQTLLKKLGADENAPGTPVSATPAQTKSAQAKAETAKPTAAEPVAAKTVTAKADKPKPGKPMVVAAAGLRLDNATLRWTAPEGKEAGPSAQLRHFGLKGIRIDAPKQRVTIDEAALSGLALAVIRLADGRIAGLPAPAAAKPAAKKQPATRAASGKPGWVVEVAACTATDTGLRLEDRSVQPASTQAVDITALSLERFSTAPDATATLKLALRFNQKGELTLAGTVRPAPLAVKLKAELRDFELLPLQPYFSSMLNLTVTKGQVTGAGDIELAEAADGSLGGSFRGQTTVGNFHSVDKRASADFLTWKSLHLDGIDVKLKPLALAVGEVALTDFYARVIISPKGKLNLMHLAKKDPAATDPQPATEPAKQDGAKTPPAQATAEAPVAQSAAPATPIRIAKVTLQGGTIGFSDHFIKPNYSARLANVGGRITGISSAAGSTATLDLRGSYDGAPLTIAGTLNLLAAKPALDIKTEVRGVELTPMSPYAGKYAGYAIEKGKLSLYLGYKIEDGKLKADNRIFLDQLTFGDKVDSPEATKLPVTLAVALLKNRRGEIDINLPISGSLDDPDFSVGGIVMQVIMNLLTKAVTSPFALLGSLFSGGEELSFVAFEPGRATLTPEALKRLESLAKSINDRPALSLEIAGRVDPEKDAEGLRQASLQHQVKAQKLARLVRQGKEAGSADSVTVDDKEYLELLTQAYNKANFPKPRNFIGLTKGLPREEMEKLMLANAPAGENEQRELADERAKAVADWLRSQGKVPGERVFMLPPRQAGDSGGPKNAPLARAEFSLK